MFTCVSSPSLVRAFLGTCALATAPACVAVEDSDSESSESGEASSGEGSSGSGSGEAGGSGSGEAGEAGGSGEAGDTGGSGDSGDTGTVDCEAACGGWADSRECEFDACCSCVSAGGSFGVLESWPPQYTCEGVEPGAWSGDTCEWGHCESERAVVEDHETPVPEVGMSAAELLALVGDRTHSASFTWQGEPGALSFALEGQTDLLSVGSVSGTGEVFLVDPLWVPPPDLPNEPGQCAPPYLEAPVRITLSTQSGGLAESFEAGAIGRGDSGEAVAVWLEHELALDTLMGSLNLQPGSANHTIDEAATLRLDYWPDAIPGSFTVGVGFEDENVAGFGWVPIAQWP